MASPVNPELVKDKGEQSVSNVVERASRLSLIRRALFMVVWLAFWIGAAILLMIYFFPSNVAFEKAQNPAVISQFGNILNPHRLLYMEIRPYTGYHSPAHTTEEGVAWGRPFRFRTNNYGFMTPYDIHPFDPPAADKNARKKVVVVTGGSASWGWGASCNEKTFPYVLERILNSSEPGLEWHVVNLSMGTWIAYQEYIALDLYGAPLQPDWIVTFDGRNDVCVPTAHGEGVPNYYFFQGQKLLNELFDRQEGEEDRALPFLKYRELSERINRISKTPPPLWTEEELDKAVRFYVRTLEAIACRFSLAKILYVSQPTQFLFSKDEKDAMAHIARKGYEKFLPLVAQLSQRYPHTRHLDATHIFPKPLEEYFVDDCHLRDSGHEIVATKIAEEILKTRAQ